MSRIHIIGHCDSDSYCSMAIIKRFHNFNNIKIIITNYGKQMDYLNDIENGDIVYVVDFTLPIDILKSLNNRCKLYVIDHHTTSIEDFKKYDFNPEGIRDVNYVFLTHPHPDHFFNVGMFPNAKLVESFGIWYKDTVVDYDENFSPNIKWVNVFGK